MGKKGERGAKEKNAALEEEARNAAKKAEHGEEEYQCTGILEQDFVELCMRAGFQEIPKVVMRPQPRPVTVPEEPDPVAEKEGLNALTLIQYKYAYFRPTIQVEMEQEDPKTTKEIFIRSWKIEEKMLCIFAKCLPTLTHLQAIRLWKVGLTDHTFLSLISIVPNCPTLKCSWMPLSSMTDDGLCRLLGVGVQEHLEDNILGKADLANHLQERWHRRMLALEGNPLPERSFYKLISEDTTLGHLCLRSNEIDDEGAFLIGQALSSLKSSNKNLISINLSYNHITDVGAGYIANGLRLNRSLLSLSLSHNKINDGGALKLAEVLGPFALTHTEVVERRHLLLEKECQERCRLPQRHSDFKSERPSSHASSTAIDKLQPAKAAKSANKKKDPLKKDEKGLAGGGTAAQATPAAQTKKEDAKQAKKAVPAADQKAVRGKGTKPGTKDKRAQVLEVEVMEPTEMLNPLLEPAEHRDGKVFLPGNRVLIYLNLIRNQITERGLKAFLAALEHQSSRAAPGGKGPMGLLRLSLAKNNYPMESKTFARIQEMMVSRDPLPKAGAAARTVEEEAGAT